MIKTRVAFWRAGFYPANQSNLKSFQKSLVGWKKSGPLKSHYCFDLVNRLIVFLNPSKRDYTELTNFTRKSQHFFFSRLKTLSIFHIII